MTSHRRLIAAATLIATAALAPALAAADDRRDRDRREDRYDDRLTPPPAPAHVHDRGCGHDARFQAPAWTWRDDLRWNGRDWVRAGWQREEQGWRLTQARSVRLELVQLDRDRAAFYDRFGHNRRKLARYDARYFERRAELERELQRLTWYAAR